LEAKNRKTNDPKPAYNIVLAIGWLNGFVSTEVQNSTVVLLFSSSAKLNFSATISQPSQSCQNVTGNFTEPTATNQTLTDERQTEIFNDDKHRPTFYRASFRE